MGEIDYDACLNHDFTLFVVMLTTVLLFFSFFMF